MDRVGSPKTEDTGAREWAAPVCGHGVSVQGPTWRLLMIVSTPEPSARDTGGGEGERARLASAGSTSMAEVLASNGEAGSETAPRRDAALLGWWSAASATVGKARQ